MGEYFCQIIWELCLKNTITTESTERTENTRLRFTSVFTSLRPDRTTQQAENTEDNENFFIEIFGLQHFLFSFPSPCLGMQDIYTREKTVPKTGA
jgi:hypothetical protein